MTTIMQGTLAAIKNGFQFRLTRVVKIFGLDHNFSHLGKRSGLRYKHRFFVLVCSGK